MTTQSKYRERALHAAKGYLTRMSIIPSNFKQIEEALDDLAREGHWAGKWYQDCSDNQAKLLKSDFNKWLKNNERIFNEITPEKRVAYLSKLVARNPDYAEKKMIKWFKRETKEE